MLLRMRRSASTASNRLRHCFQLMAGAPGSTPETRARLVFCLALLGFFFALPLASAANRSTILSYDSFWSSGPASKWMALDPAHQQVFAAWYFVDRVDVLSTLDYHLIRSIAVPSPSTLDISPDGSTVAVGSYGGSHILFFDTTTFAETNDMVFPEAGLGISAFLYTANGNAMIGGGVTAYWDHAANSFLNVSNGGQISSTVFNAGGPMARSGDYSKIMLAEPSSAGGVQVIDGNSGQILYTTGFGGYIVGLAANNNGSRYAVCVQIPGYGNPNFVILDSAYDQIYQDSDGCVGMTFSADGQKLYRDVELNSAQYTQALDMTSFAEVNVPNYFTAKGASWTGDYTNWQAADSSGMVYGVNSNISGGVFGPILWIALDMTSTSAPQPPTASNPVKIVRVVDNIGSPQGGDSIRLICTGVTSVTQNQISVSIGGAPAASVAIFNGLNMPNQVFVSVKTPPGTPGLADIVLYANGGTDTAHNAFQYAASRTIFPVSTSPNFLLYDPTRNRLYASHKDQVEAIDIGSQTMLTPLVPAAGKLANSNFSGLSLSPDGNRLYIADTGAGQIHMLNLSSPGQGLSIDVGKAIGSSGSVGPSRVVELSNGKVMGSNGGQLFLIDPATQTGDWVRDSSGNQIGGFLWNSVNHGDKVLISRDGDAFFNSFVGLLSADSSNNFAPSVLTEWLVDASANEDGTVIGVGGSSASPEIVDMNLDPLGLIEEHFDVAVPNGKSSFDIHPSGALLYTAGTNTLGATSYPGGTVEIDDMRLFQPAASVAFPEPFMTSGTPLTDHTFTTDPTGKYLFGVTQSGITMMTLGILPLSIGNVQPAFIQAGTGQALTLRGSGFQPGATVTIGGAQTSVTYVDPNTLSVAAPALAAGWLDVKVSLPTGVSYTAAALLKVLGSLPTPSVTGFFPPAIVVQLGIPDKPATVTVLGSNFDSYDSVEIDGQPVASAFLDSGHMQATIPASLTRATGALAITVASPYDGSSNSLGLPVVNPVPVPQDNPAISFAAGAPFSLNLYGTGFVAGSIIQWNGQNLPTSLSNGETPSGLETLSASVGSSLTQLSANAIITVYNPPPGGGVSAPITATLGYQPTPAYTIIGPGDVLLNTYYSIPPTIDFGTQVLNTSTTFNVNVMSVGTLGYSVSSLAVSSGAFSTTTSSCPALGSGITCVVPLTFTPTAAGTATGTLTISDNLPGSPHSVTLTGTGIQTPLPVVSLTSISDLGDTVTARVFGSAVLGGPTIPATAWIEYGTDQTLATYSQSTSWTFTGDQGTYGDLSGLSADTLYAARIAVQTAGGVGRSPIHLFSTAPAWPLVVISLATGASNSATVTAGKTATYSLLASDGGFGYIGTATFTCTGAPTGAACTISPSQVPLSVTASAFNVNVTTTAAQAAVLKKPGPGLDGFGWALCLTFGAGALASRKRLRRIGLFLFLMAASLACLSCGGGGSTGSGGGPPPVAGTPAGTYSLTITGTTGSFQVPYSIQLVVQ
jgi:hypothetical protein